MIKYKTFIIKTFDQLKNDNFDQVKFDQVSVSLLSSLKSKNIFIWKILILIKKSNTLYKLWEI